MHLLDHLIHGAGGWPCAVLQRKLVLMGKLLVCVANRAFTDKESYLKGVVGHVLQISNALDVFYEELLVRSPAVR